MNGGLFGTSRAFDRLTDVLSCVTGAIAAPLSAHRRDKQNTLGLSKYCNHVWLRSFYFAHLLYNLICSVSGHGVLLIIL